MKKTNVLTIISNLIFLIIFNAIFFVAGGAEHNASVWISYGFIHFAYFMLILTPLLISKGKSSAVFGFSLYTISSAYFFAEFVIGAIFILLSPTDYKLALFVQICILGLYGAILISNMLANEHTADAEEKRQYQIDYVKAASAKVKALLESVEDKELQKKVEKVYDAIYSSPVKSHPNLAQTEAQILVSVGELENAVFAGNKDAIASLSNSLLLTINERNRQLKIL